MSKNELMGWIWLDNTFKLAHSNIIGLCPNIYEPCSFVHVCYNYNVITKLKQCYTKRTLVLYFVDNDLNVGGETKDYFIV
jgi:hypothetical protein